MTQAYELAKKAYKKGEVPVGCIIVKENKIIAKAYNNKENRNNPLGHAEIIAITKATKKIKNWRLDECDIYVTLQPCNMCFFALKESRIKKIYYGAKDNKQSLDYLKKTDERLLENMKYMPHKLSSQIIKKFFKSKR